MAVAVPAGAHKSLVLAIAGAVTAAQLYLTFANKNKDVNMKMAAITAVMCLYPVASKPNTGEAATYWLFWSTLAPTIAYNVAKLKEMADKDKPADESSRWDSAGARKAGEVNLTLVFILSVIVVIAMAVVYLMDMLRGAGGYEVFVVMIIIQSLFCLFCMALKQEVLKPVVKNTAVALAATGICFVLFLTGIDDIISFDMYLGAKLIPFVFSLPPMSSALKAKKSPPGSI